MTKQELKIKLLQTNLFIDNSYLQDYLDLVNNSTIEGYTEKHHILPRCWYKYNKQPVDNSEDNVVNLAYKDHCKAHWLLYFCTKDYLQQANETAVRYISEMYKKLTGTEKHKFDFVQADFELLQTYMNDIIADKDSRHWSIDELNIIIQNYKIFGPDYCCALLINRTRSSIINKARELNIIYRNYWTPEEISFLLQNYEDKGITFCCNNLARTRDTIIQKAHKLGLVTKVIDLNLYTVEEINFIKQNYPKYGAKYCAAALDRTPGSIHGLVCTLGIKKDTFWTDEKILFLKQNYSAFGGAYCAEYLQTTKKIIFKKAKHLGLSRDHKKKAANGWTEEELAILKQYYPLEGCNVYKRLVNRSYNATRSMASILGLKRDKEKFLNGENNDGREN